jgi:poly(hydroxyalkanoate) granule-associated protein
MATTPRKKADDNYTVHTIMESANQIWLAGLGAFAKTQEEGGKFFEALVKEGEEVEARTRKVADDMVEDVKGKVQSMTGKAADKLDKLEQAFQNRVARALGRLGVPTYEDVLEISRRLDALQQSIRELDRHH